MSVPAEMGRGAEAVTASASVLGGGRFARGGVAVARRFTKPGADPLATTIYGARDSKIPGTTHEMLAVECPTSWSDKALDIITSKYFRKAGVPATTREISVRQPVRRIALAIRMAGERLGDYFASTEDADAFQAELEYLLINQMGAFNSPVWFNLGMAELHGITGEGAGNFYWNPLTATTEETKDAYTHPQSSACFIQSVRDDLMDIAAGVQREMRLFKFGSGTGTNFSKIRAEGESLSAGGTSSGLMSFLDVFDKGAGAIKSGGTTRRAAKMVCLDMDHPDIERFVEWKAHEEDKIIALLAAGFGKPGDFNSEAYRTVSGQNSNNSVMVTDAFMGLSAKDLDWNLVYRTTKKISKTIKAKGLWRKIAEAAWKCADPGVMFYDTMNRWNCVPNSGPIEATNPCGEFVFLNDTSCNLASINLVKFLVAHEVLSSGNGAKKGHVVRFDIDAFKHACRVFIVAQEILVDHSSYPTATVAQNSHELRPLGLGYANLGALLMRQSLPYASDEGVATAAAITAIMTGTAYETSAELAATKGPFPAFAHNREPMLRVMNMHRDAVTGIKHADPELMQAATACWDRAVNAGGLHGYRNAQVTVIAPTGTIGLLMDCDTTGIEPDFALVKSKLLAGGGVMNFVNQSIGPALENLGYGEREREAIVTYTKAHGVIEGAPGLKPEHLPVFDCANKCGVLQAVTPAEAQAFEHWAKATGLGFDNRGPEKNKDGEETGLVMVATAGKRFIEPSGHVKMLAAVTPFLSGSASKTINMPNESTVDDIEALYTDAWRKGIKAISIYRDGSKSAQVLSTGSKQKKKDEPEASPAGPIYKPLPNKRRGTIQKARVGGQKMYVISGEYPDGKLGEVFICMNKIGSAHRATMDSFAISVSIGLQHGVPLEKYTEQMMHTQFEPRGGVVGHDRIKTASSPLDYLAKHLALEYLGEDEYLPQLTAKPEAESPTPKAKPTKLKQAGNSAKPRMSGTPFCEVCGGFTVRTGSCVTCQTCGHNKGCG